MMLLHYTKKEVNENKCAQFLVSINTDGNQFIQKTDFISFLGIGLTLSSEELKEYSEQEALHQTLGLLIVELNEQMKGTFSGQICF